MGLDVDDLAGSCILDDFNNDDRIDIVASSWSLKGQLRIFFRESDGRFVERTAESGLAGLVSGLNIQQTDYDNDGWMDIWVMRGAWLGTAGAHPEFTAPQQPRRHLHRRHRIGGLVQRASHPGLDLVRFQR